MKHIRTIYRRVEAGRHAESQGCKWEGAKEGEARVQLKITESTGCNPEGACWVGLFAVGWDVICGLLVLLSFLSLDGVGYNPDRFSGKLVYYFRTVDSKPTGGDPQETDARLGTRPGMAVLRYAVYGIRYRARSILLFLFIYGGTGTEVRRG